MRTGGGYARTMARNTGSDDLTHLDICVATALLIRATPNLVRPRQLPRVLTDARKRGQACVGGHTDPMCGWHHRAARHLARTGATELHDEIREVVWPLAARRKAPWRGERPRAAACAAQAGRKRDGSCLLRRLDSRRAAGVGQACRQAAVVIYYTSGGSAARALAGRAVWRGHCAGG